MTTMTTTTDRTNRAYIGQMLVGSRYGYILYSPYSGVISEHRTAHGLSRAAVRHARGCRAQGGYSDAQTYGWEDALGAWTVVHDDAHADW